ncbi:MAG TPA: SpoIIE family protein phosphatase [Vicinamibacterales bacterium]|nr:SpoIIE family protein phosphatase [Vicinamibacterales bacterium]
MTPAPRILVADDQADILQALRLLLNDAGFETELVNSVGGVLDRVIERPYDLLLMDLNYTRDTTSGREGLELLDRVRSHDGTLPVVVMTGWGSIDTAVEAMRRGARSFVQKPWDDLTLVDVVRREVEDGMALRRRDAKLAREHDEARLIQRALLPSSMPEITGCTLAALWTPASGIGGDCYDVLRFSDTRVAVSIADVVGKGLPAALLMSNLQAAVRAFSTAAAEPHDVCASVNRLLCRNIASGKFVTFCYAVIDTSAMTIAYANAGHFPPVLMRADGRAEQLAPTGLVLGVTADWAYTSRLIEVGRGDRLVCYTDGITEALTPDNGEFGEDRLVETIRALRTEPPDRLARAVSDAVTAWTGGAPQDDATLIVAAMA